MFDIPDKKDPLIEQLFSIIEKKAAKEKPRGYVGASSIGDSCERKLYYKLRHADKAAPRKAKLILAANDGHRSEDLSIHYLREIPGVRLQTSNMGEGFGQLGFSDFDGMFKGHIDGIIDGIPEAPKTTHIWENKCVNETKFKKLISLIEKLGSKQALKEWDYSYYCQAVIYMSYFELSRHYMTIWLTGNRDLITIRTEENKPLAEQLKAKARRVINYENAPCGISDNPSWYECKFCEFREFCHAPTSN